MCLADLSLMLPVFLTTRPQNEYIEESIRVRSRSLSSLILLGAALLHTGTRVTSADLTTTRSEMVGNSTTRSASASAPPVRCTSSRRWRRPCTATRPR